jgi:hypothetical protein
VASNENAWGQENAPSCIVSSAALHLLAWPFFYRVRTPRGEKRDARPHLHSL